MKKIIVIVCNKERNTTVCEHDKKEIKNLLEFKNRYKKYLDNLKNL